MQLCSWCVDLIPGFLLHVPCTGPCKLSLPLDFFYFILTETEGRFGFKCVNGRDTSRKNMLHQKIPLFHLDLVLVVLPYAQGRCTSKCDDNYDLDEEGIYSCFFLQDTILKYNNSNIDNKNTNARIPKWKVNLNRNGALCKGAVYSVFLEQLEFLTVMKSETFKSPPGWWRSIL